MGPKNKEDPADKAARLRERRVSLLENRRAAQGTAEGLTTDYGSVYNLGALSMFGQKGTGRSNLGTAPAPTNRKSTTPKDSRSGR